MNLEYVLLGLINLHPSVSGYELKSIITISTGYFFSASLSQIYPALKTLSNEKAISFEVEALVGKQDRKVYTITPKGKEMLKNWLNTPLELNQSLNAFQEFLLRLTFMGIMDDEEIITFLQSGLRFFKHEKERLTADNLTNEKGFLKTEIDLFARQVFIWHHEADFLGKDLDQKIEFIEQLINDINLKKIGKNAK